MASDLENWSVEKWLKKLGLRKYKQSFLDNGYDTAELCASLNKEDLDAIGVTNKQHRSTLFTQARKLLKLVDEESFLASEEIVEESAPAKTKAKKGDQSPQLSSGSGHTPPPPSMPPPPSSAPPPSAAPLPDYSEPWNSKALPLNSSATKNGNQTGLKKLTTGTDVADGPSPVHRKTSGPKNRKNPPLSPGVELPVYKREGSAGVTRTRLQLKLKIREELFVRDVVLTEPPYCWEDGAPDEQEIMDLAADLAEKFEVESLEMFDALKDVWSNANKSDFATAAARKPKVQAAPQEPKDNYDEPFDTLEGSSPSSPNRVGKPSPSSSHQKKNFTLPASMSTPNGNYDEPFDTVKSGAASPEKKKLARVETSQTLPSPSRQRRSLGDGLDNHSPSHPASSGKHSRFRLFKRKEKARSQSVRETDLQSHGLIAFPLKASPIAVKHASAENVSVTPSADQISYLARGVPPPLPSPRSQQGGSSEDSEKTPPTGKSKKYGGKKFKKFITPPTLQRNQVAHFDSFSSASSSDSDRVKSGVIMEEGMKGARSTIGFHHSSKDSDEEHEGKAWLRTSKSFDQLNTISRIEGPETTTKKSRLTKFISRLKRKSVTPSSQKRSKGKSAKDSNRESVASNVSNMSSVSGMSRERSLTASMSMPDISNLTSKPRHQHSATPSNDGYAEVFDAIKPEPDASRYSPKANTFHRGPTCEESDNQKSGEQQNVPPKPSRPPPQSSPVTISPPPKHQKMFIRGSSDSSGPDNIFISMNHNAPPTRGSEVGEDAESASLVSGVGIGSRTGSAVSATSADSVKMSDSEDASSLHFGRSDTPIKRAGSAGSDGLEAPIGRVGSAGSGVLQTRSPVRRVGSAASDTLEAPIGRFGSTGSNTSQGKKPPTMPKPPMLSAKSKSNPNALSPAQKGPRPTTPVSPPPATMVTPDPAKPPRKPARGLSHKVKVATPTVTPTSTNKDTPAGVSPIPKGRVSPRPVRSSAPPNPRPTRSSEPGGPPPPKPARVASVRLAQSKSESDSGVVSNGREAVSPTPSPPSPLALNSAPQGTPPPPKPTRRGKSVKILDPSSENRSNTLSKSRPMKPPPQTPQKGYTTLPHHFKAKEHPAPAPRGAGSPKPVPRPRTSMTMLSGDTNPPEGSGRKDA